MPRFHEGWPPIPTWRAKPISRTFIDRSAFCSCPKVSTIFARTLLSSILIHGYFILKNYRSFSPITTNTISVFTRRFGRPLGPLEGVSPFRPAFLWLQDFTFENFDEQAYMDSNPDIANAVRDGYLESARKHFESYGYKEGRARRRWTSFPAATSEETPSPAAPSVSLALERLRARRNSRAGITDQLQSGSRH